MEQPASDDIVPFRLSDLPAELRERVYESAMAPFPPMDTASILNTPDRVQISPIAQLSRDTRREALSVFYRKRPLILSLNCDRNVDRTRSWLAKALGDTVELSNTVTLRGTGARLPFGETYFFVITCHRTEPYYTVSGRHAASESAAQRFRNMKGQLEKLLQSILDQKTDDRRGRLGAGDISSIVTMIMKAAGYYAVPPHLR